MSVTEELIGDSDSKSLLPKILLIRSRAIDPAVRKWAHTLSQNGYDVSVLIWDRSKSNGIEELNNYSIHWFMLKAPYDKISIILYLPLWWMYELLFIMKNKYDVIHACDFDTLMPAIIAKKLKRSKLYYTIFDFYSANFPDTIPQIIKKTACFLEKYGIQFSDVLFLTDEARYKQVEGAKIKSVVYIYNSPPNHEGHNLTKNSNDHSPTVLFYAGLLHKTRGLQFVVDAIEKIDNIKLVIAGTGDESKIFENLPYHLKEKITYLGWLSYEDVIKKTRESDIQFAFYDPQIPNNCFASPNKLFEAMMCSKPIIMNSETTASQIVLHEKCGLAVPYGNVDAIKEAILKLQNDPNLRTKLGENGRKAYITKYSWDIMASRLVKTYDQNDNRK